MTQSIRDRLAAIRAACIRTLDRPAMEAAMRDLRRSIVADLRARPEWSDADRLDLALEVNRLLMP